MPQPPSEKIKLQQAKCTPPPSAESESTWISQDAYGILVKIHDRQEELFAQVMQLTSAQQFVRQESGRSVASQRVVQSKAGSVDSMIVGVIQDIPESKPLAQAAVDTGDPSEVNAISGDDGEKPALYGGSSASLGSGSPNKNRRTSKLAKNLGAQAQFEEEAGLMDRTRKYIASRNFELIMCFVILASAFTMCWESEYDGLKTGFKLRYQGHTVDADVAWRGASTAFNYLDWLFGILFTAEISVKLIFFRSAFFYVPFAENGFSLMKKTEEEEQPAWKCNSWDIVVKIMCGIQGWNLLDATSVAVFIFDKIAVSAITFLNPRILRLLRLLRLARLVRLLRFLETLDHLYVMTTAISGLRNVLAWAVVLLTLMLLTCDLFLVQLLQVSYFDQVKVDTLTDAEMLKYQEMYSWFGTCSRCMLTMFEMTLGNWGPPARLLCEEVSGWFVLVCLLHKVSIGFAVVGVITGCILQETFKVAQTDDIIMFRQKKLAQKIFRKKMEGLFEILDTSGDAKLDKDEFDAITASPDLKAWLASLNIETDDLGMMFKLIDVDRDGQITLEEMLSRMPRLQGPARSLDILALRDHGSIPWAGTHPSQ